MGPIVKVSKDLSGTLDSLWEVQVSFIGLEYMLFRVAVSPNPPESLALVAVFRHLKRNFWAFLGT